LAHIAAQRVAFGRAAHRLGCRCGRITAAVAGAKAVELAQDAVDMGPLAAARYLGHWAMVGSPPSSASDGVPRHAG